MTCLSSAKSGATAPLVSTKVYLETPRVLSKHARGRCRRGRRGWVNEVKCSFLTQKALGMGTKLILQIASLRNFEFSLAYWKLGTYRKTLEYTRSY